MKRLQFARTEALIGSAALTKLRESRVLLFGVGGVGSYVCEALARAGIGSLTIVDRDDVDETNINRQLIALHSTVGRPKVQVAAERVRDINPDIEIIPVRRFYLPENSGDIDFASFDYVVDAVDNVTAKIDIIVRAKEAGVPVISSMGTGNKMDSSAFRVCDISKTRICPLAKTVRKELRKRGTEGVKVVYSEEIPHRFWPARRTEIPEENGKNSEAGRESCRRKIPPASISFVPGAAGLLIAGEVVKDIISSERTEP